MGVLSEKDEPSGTDRMRKKDQGKPIAGKSTLNRLELTPEEANEKSRYKKIVADGAAIDELMVEVFIESNPCAPSEIVLISMLPMIRSMVIRKGEISTAITPRIATCRYKSLRRALTMCQTAPGRQGPGQRRTPRASAHCRTDSSPMARGENHRARGFRILSR